MFIKVGEPFRIHLNGHTREKGVMQEVADEMMIEIAKLMPESYRGVYANRVGQPLEFISYSV